MAPEQLPLSVPWWHSPGANSPAELAFCPECLIAASRAVPPSVNARTRDVSTPLGTYEAVATSDHDQSTAHEAAERQILGLIPRRLGPEAPGPVPDHMRSALVLSLEWQQIGAYAEFWEAAGAEENRLYELAGCRAGIGEQVGLACTAERDYLGWERMTLEGAEAVEAEMAKRALAEVVGHYVLGAGHGLFNLAARTVALDQTLKGDLRNKLGTDFPPLSEQRRDWPQAAKAATLQQVARGSAIPEIQSVADPIVALVASDEWEGLNDARGSDFHRWRVQTDGIAGVAKQPPWKKGDGVRSLEIGAMRPLGEDAQAKLAEKTLSVAVAARHELVKAAASFDCVFADAVAATTRLTVGDAADR
jgi:hypothetical protein